MWNESFFSAPQLKRIPLDGTLATKSPLTPLAARDRQLYGAGLAEIRRRRRLSYWTSVAFIPVGLGSAVILRAIIPFDFLFYLLVVLINGAWMGMMVVTALRVGDARCPRCADRFHRGRWWSNPWTHRCMSCGLSLRADDGAV